MSTNKMWARFMWGVTVIIFFICLWVVAGPGCVTTKLPTQAPPQLLEITVNDAEVKATNGDELDKKIKASERIANMVKRSMSVDNPDLQLSRNTSIMGKVAYMKITNISSWNAEDLWSDFKYLQTTDIERIDIFMNNSGGDAMQGCSISDELRIFSALQKLKENPITIIMEARGIVASAAVPVLLSADYRVASRNTVFMIHPGGLWKGGGWVKETLKDLEEQAAMMKVMNDRYSTIVSENSKLSKSEVLELMKKTTWWTAKEAKELGFVHEIQ